MDIDFLVQDSFSLTRPQWRLAANLEEAGRAFADIVKQNYKSHEAEKSIEPEEPEDDSSEGEGDDEDLPVPEMDDGQSSGDEADAEARSPLTCQRHLLIVLGDSGKWRPSARFRLRRGNCGHSPRRRARSRS